MVALLFRDEILTSLDFDEDAANQITFVTVKCTDPIVNSTGESGIMRNGRKFNHIFYKHKDLEVVISSNEIDSTMLEFLQDFWTATIKYIALQESDIWSNYVQVLTESGKFPLSYVNDIKLLPEVSFNFSYAHPV